MSHLPQVASTALMSLAASEEADEPEILLLAAGGFRDLTRLAASDASLWSSILLANRAQIAEALARHAPQVPITDVTDTDTGAMDVVVRAAGELAQEGDVVLLAPAAASMDMFRNYEARGDAFAQAVRTHLGR